MDQRLIKLNSDGRESNMGFSIPHPIILIVSIPQSRSTQNVYDDPGRLVRAAVLRVTSVTWDCLIFIPHPTCQNEPVPLPPKYFPFASHAHPASRQNYAGPSWINAALQCYCSKFLSQFIKFPIRNKKIFSWLLDHGITMII